jgi:ribosome biogenesis protein ENP2
MKFERYVNSEIIDLIMLGEDYGKMAMLLDDRTIAFHAHYGSHETIRIPKFGRGMAYEPTTCELLVAAQGNNVFRLNLEEGRHSEPWTFEPTNASASCISVSNAQPLAAVGCDDGIVRFWDNRTPDSLLKPFLKMDVQSATAGYGFGEEGGLYSRNPHEITSIAHDTSGLYIAAGTAGGIVALYDVRSSKPLHIKEHKLGMPIHTIKFHSGSGSILSSDEKLVKIWRYKSNGDLVHRSDGFGDMEGGDNNKNLGSIVANIEGTGKFTNFVMAGDEKDPLGNKSGLLLCATDQPKLESYYIPKVGLAPKWCSFLESITEELEERDLNRDGSGGDFVQDGQEAVFENYKFVSREDVEKLGISDLVGTPMLRGYMHGFFMDINLYNRVRAVANPFEYEEYRKKKLKEKINAKRASRIAPKEKRAKAAVNPELADRLLGKADDSTKAGKFANKMLQDDRFGNLFNNPDYQINENDDDFKLRNPSGVANIKANAKKKRKDDMDSDDEGSDVDDEDENVNVAADEPDEAVGFRPVQQSDNEASDDDHSDDGDSDSDEDGFRGGKVRFVLKLFDKVLLPVLFFFFV